MAVAREAVAAQPADALIRRIAHHACTDGIEGFHADMLRDAARNRVFAEAIAAAAPGRRVLDIGTGSALLAMMAARAGAAHIHACEADPRLAATAREIVAANGLAGQITVHAMHSTKLDAARDLDGGVDLVISELFSQNLVGEGVLATLADARARLCNPDARFLPGRAAVRVALAEFAGCAPPFAEVGGFDLALFNRHVAAQDNVRQGRRDLVLRSSPADLFAFDFDAGAPREHRTRIALPATGGRVTGLIQWIRFETGPGLVYENAPAPDSHASHWVLQHHRLATPITLATDAVVPVHGWYRDDCLLAWCGD